MKKKKFKKEQISETEREVKALFFKYFNMHFDKDYEKKESKKIIKFPNSKCWNCSLNRYTTFR